MSLHSARRSGGFTLLEIMAAFAMFALLFGLMMQILSTSMSNTRRAGDFTQAALWAQSKLDVLGVESMIQTGRSTGQFDNEFSWSMEITEELVFDERGLDVMELPLHLYRVVLEVEWSNGRRSQRFETLRSVDVNWEERQRDFM
jgi:general secretion pathway protein I